MSLILASASPRRSQLLAQAGLAFKVVPAEVEELGGGSSLPPEDFAMANAALKARAVKSGYPDDTVLGADTIVVLDHTILGKPANKADAIDMLTMLNNREHEVITGISIHGPASMQKNWCVRTAVVFRSLDIEEIHAYVATGEPMDKAGSYAIQGRASQFIREIHGSYTNVVGLPLAEVIEALKGCGGR